MSEIKEQPMMKDREAGVVQRVTNKIGKFLSETYTFKGATEKETVKKYSDIYNQFTGETKQEMMHYYSKVAEKSARWKVVRNWIVTGAGLALGAGVLHAGWPAVAEFVTHTAPAAIKGGAEAAYAWLFQSNTLAIHTGGGFAAATPGIVDWTPPVILPPHIPIIDKVIIGK